MWLVGYFHNNNGMGTWCWESAHALAEAGEAVTLVCSDEVSLPCRTTLPILRIAPRKPSGLTRHFTPGGLAASRGPLVMREAVRQLERSGTPATVILVNATEFVDTDIPLPQMTAAWASGVRLRDFLGRIGIGPEQSLRDALHGAIGTIGWYRRDWRGYGGAAAVLAVTTPLTEELRRHGVAAELVHPCTHTDLLIPPPRDSASPVRLVTAAASLDDPRKQVSWLLDAVDGAALPDCTLTLVGDASLRLRERAGSLRVPVSFTGMLTREESVRTLREHDVFLFASRLDDWGYVLSEAMAQGVAVVAPSVEPFVEILGETGALYPPGSAPGLVDALERMLRDPQRERARCLSRAQLLFSRSIFVERLRAVLRAHVQAGARTGAR